MVFLTQEFVTSSTFSAERWRSGHFLGFCLGSVNFFSLRKKKIKLAFALVFKCGFIIFPNLNSTPYALCCVVFSAKLYAKNFPAIHMNNNVTCDVIRHVLWFLYLLTLQKGSQGNVALVTFQGCNFDFLLQHSFVTWSQFIIFFLTKVKKKRLWMLKSVKKKPHNKQPDRCI